MSPKLIGLRVPYVCDACGATFVREYNEEVPTRVVECPLCGEDAHVGNPIQGLREEIHELRAEVFALRGALPPALAPMPVRAIDCANGVHDFVRDSAILFHCRACGKSGIGEGK
jgi:hypothetical protein